MGFETVSRTHVGLRRKINEDSLLSLPERGLWAVADGMGGHEAGEVASAMVVEALAQAPSAPDVDSLLECAVAALERSNRELLRLAHANMNPRTIGTTVVGLVIAGGRYGSFWAGDSRAYRLRREELVQLSRDHSLVQDLVEAGMLRPEEAERHPNANVVTRAVGASEELIVDTAAGDVLPGDRFLLASDGLTRVVSDVELRTELERHPPADAADRLLDCVLSRGAPDNVTMILIEVPSPARDER